MEEIANSEKQSDTWKEFLRSVKDSSRLYQKTTKLV